MQDGWSGFDTVEDMKIIKVKSCVDCPNRHTYEAAPFCGPPYKSYCHGEGKDIPDITEIPDWCPLPDVDEDIV